MEYSYFRLRPKDNPKINGIVLRTTGKALENFVGDDIITPISEEEALKLQKDAQYWKDLQAYVATDSGVPAAISPGLVVIG